jgi:hypothetical protein
MKKKGYKYYLIIDKTGMIVNADDFKTEVDVEATVHILDTFGTVEGFNSLKQIEKYIKDNNLTFPEAPVEINPFEGEWSDKYPNAKLRMYLSSMDANRLSIEQPEFIMLLSQLDIKMLIDTDYEVVWAYLEYIEKEHKKFLEKDYNAKFEYRNV